MDPDISKAREILYEKLKTIIPEKYEKFSSSLSMTQLRDTLNYLLTFSAFFRSQEGLPMEEYVAAENVKKAAESEIEEFFKSIDCEYKKVSIKSFNT
jgi:glutamyl-tRNA reductase